MQSPRSKPQSVRKLKKTSTNSRADPSYATIRDGGFRGFLLLKKLLPRPSRAPQILYLGDGRLNTTHQWREPPSGGQLGGKPSCLRPVGTLSSERPPLEGVQQHVSDQLSRNTHPRTSPQSNGSNPSTEAFASNRYYLASEISTENPHASAERISRDL